MKIGPYQIELLETGHFRLDGGAMFGVVPKTLWNQSNPSDEKNRVELAMRVLLVLYKDRKILVDVGAGEKYSPKQQEIFQWDNGKSDLKKSLRQHGISPEQVTDVVLTHCHFDHAGGGTEFRDQQTLLTFPRATYYVQDRHWRWALNPTDRDRGSFLKEDIEPLQKSEQIKTIPGGNRTFPRFSLNPV